MKTQRMTGRQLQGAIIELAHMYGWQVAHFPSMLVTGRSGRPFYATPLAADAKGFPDMVLVRRDDRVIFVEVKGHGDSLRPEQEVWLELLRSAGCETYVWTPKDLAGDEILNTLQERVADPKTKLGTVRQW